MQPILKINLTSGEINSFPVPRIWEQEFLGGTALAARLLYSELSKVLDPFSPEAPLLFITGPLTGTAGPAVGRFAVCGKSPATQLWAESNCGGYWGPELRFCGYDGLWVVGKAEHPVYIWINDNNIELRDATHLWGRDTFETEELINRELEVINARVLCIGTAGENGIVFSGFFCDHGRTAGRTGLGAVAGAKNLKAIAVKGHSTIPIIDPDQFRKIRRESNIALKNDNISQVTHELGTAGVADYTDYIGSMPKKYFHQGVLDNIDQISGATMSETILSGVATCHGCVIACKRVVKLDDGEKRKGPEYETIVGFGPNLLITNLESIVKANELCDRFGMDTISTSNVIGLAFHLFEKGILNEKEVGFPLNWGDKEAVHKLIHMIAYQDGIGELMSKGSKSFASDFGALEEAVQVNGLEVAYHDPRGVTGMALVYATSPRGACHNKSDYFFVDWGQAEPNLELLIHDPRGGAEKATNVARHQDWRSLFDSMIMCSFANIPLETITRLVNSCCGYNLTGEDLFKIGERGWTIKRAINNRLGLIGENDTLPKALLEPLQDGASQNFVPEFKDMLSAYYLARKWDPLSGKPLKEKLVEINLDDIAKDLWE